MKASSFGFRALALAALSLATGCGVGFDSPTEVKTLRVLAVQKDAPYAAPGAPVTLRMLWADGSEAGGGANPRPIQILWLPPCTNPPGGLYYGCFPQIGQGLVERLERCGALGCSDSDADPSDATDDFGDTFSFNIAPDVEGGIFDTGVEPTPGQPPRFGQTFVFFAACAGNVKLVEQPEEGALPLACFGEDGAQLGPDSFVAGYTTLSTFPPEDEITNANPVVQGLTVAGVDATTCTDGSPDSCLHSAGSPTDVIDCNAAGAPCVEACEDDGDAEECPEIDLEPLIPETLSASGATNAERDGVALRYFDRNVGEQMWINYYATGGGMKSEVRLLNDATHGWNEEYGTKYFAPKKPGPVTIWAAAHDNRGGVGWAQARIWVTE